MVALRRLSILLLAIALLYGAGPAHVEGPPADAGLMRRYAADTWRSIAAMERASGLPTDHLLRTPDGSWAAAAYTSPTNVAAYLWSVLGAQAIGLVEPGEARDRLDRTLQALERMDRDRGFFYNWYDPETGQPLATWPLTGTPVRPFLSCVDNGWLACALIMVGNARPEWQKRTEALLAPMDFGFFHDAYDPADPLAHPGLLRIGYWSDAGTFSGAHYGILNTEPRIASYIGIARGQLPPEHYFRMSRGPMPGEQQAGGPAPSAQPRVYRGVPVPEGSVEYRGVRVVPSWGGSMFEALMVPLFVPEAEWGPESWGANHPAYVRAQIEYGRDDLRSGSWGFSPASRPSGGYAEYGVPLLGVRPGGYPCGEPLVDPVRPSTLPDCSPVVTPHASFLALQFARAEALGNLRGLERRFPIYGDYGFQDSVDVASGTVSSAVLVLDQGMILAALANQLADKALQRYFATGAIEAIIRPLIAQERFSAGPVPAPTPARAVGAVVGGDPAPPAAPGTRTRLPIEPVGPAHDPAEDRSLREGVRNLGPTRRGRHATLRGLTSR